LTKCLRIDKFTVTKSRYNLLSYCFYLEDPWSRIRLYHKWSGACSSSEAHGAPGREINKMKFAF